MPMVKIGTARVYAEPLLGHDWRTPDHPTLPFGGPLKGPGLNNQRTGDSTRAVFPTHLPTTAGAQAMRATWPTGKKKKMELASLIDRTSPTDYQRTRLLGFCPVPLNLTRKGNTRQVSAGELQLYIKLMNRRNV